MKDCATNKLVENILIRWCVQISVIVSNRHPHLSLRYDVKYEYLCISTLIITKTLSMISIVDIFDFFPTPIIILL